MSKYVENENEGQGNTVRCWRCGRMIFQDIRTGRTGCRNTKCYGYLWGSKNLSNDLLRQVKM